MSVLELCDREIAAVGLEATVADAINKMLDHHVGAVAVVDTEYRVAGIFTERDVLRKMSLSHVDPKSTPVRELMTTPVEMATREQARERLSVRCWSGTSDISRWRMTTASYWGYFRSGICWSGAWMT